jgi:EAL domain-containing protein (putative c-di-GMP-specific phosphodiesterase class I)
MVAEGVETEEQLSILKSNDCDYGQGYLFSKPVSRHNIEKLMGVV